MDIYDLCIVGAGMFGSAAARHASADAGVKICLIGPEEPQEHEWKTREIFGAHYDEGRMVHISKDDVLLQMLAKYSINRYRELEQLSNVSFYDPVGFLMVGKRNGTFMKKVLQISGITGLPLVDISLGNTLKKRYPFLKFKDDDQVLLEDSGAGYISPRKMVEAQRKVAESQGCCIVNDVVEKVQPQNCGIHTVHTAANGKIFAKRVLFCTGAFTNLKEFPFPKLKLTLNKETVVLLKISSQEAERLSRMPPFTYCRQEDNQGAYVLPPIKYPDGNTYLKAGHIDFERNVKEITTLEEVANWYRSKGDPKKIDYLINFMANVLPGLKYEDVVTKTCMTTDSPSGEPYIDRITPTLTVATACNGRGAKFSDEVGRIAAGLSLTGSWNSDLTKSSFEAIFD